MRVSQTIAGRVFLASLTGLLGFANLGPGESRAADEVRQPVAIQFSLDRPIDASAAPFVLASGGGLFSSEGLAVTTNIASGSPDAIARVAAGTSDFAPRQAGYACRQGGVRAVQQIALRHRRPQEPGYPHALRHRG
jgi:NitT/TauT family transport system substrate-binding protein